jgi:hypothetical protein
MSSDENVESENPAAGDDRFGPLTWVPARSGVYGLDHGATPPPTIPMLNFDEIMRLQHGRANPGAPSAFAQYPPAPIASGYVAYSPRSVPAPWVPNAQTAPSCASDGTHTISRHTATGRGALHCAAVTDSIQRYRDGRLAKAHRACARTHSNTPTRSRERGLRLRQRQSNSRLQPRAQSPPPTRTKTSTIRR